VGKEGRGIPCSEGGEGRLNSYQRKDRNPALFSFGGRLTDEIEVKTREGDERT